MKYKIYQLSFPQAVHLGERSLDEALPTFCADTLFSALYQEALKVGSDYAEKFYGSAVAGKLLLSDAFPYIGNMYYLPKPMLRPETEDTQGDSVVKKAFKKLKYIPINKTKEYMAGKLDAQKENTAMKAFTKSYLKTSAAVPDDEDTKPYHVGTVTFGEDSGLYIITAVEADEDEKRLNELMKMLSYAGIGGKRASGLGRFTIVRERKMNSANFEKDSEWKMTLGISLPRDEELESVMPDAHYQIKKRSGFVASSTYAPEQRKKRDLFMFAAGSCFKNRFEGDIYDVSDGGAHPVYRYGKPLFWAL